LNFLRATLPDRAVTVPADELLESGIGIYLRGLGRIGPDD